VDDGGTRLYGASACRGASKEKAEEYIAQTGAKLTSYAVAVVNPGESYLYRDGEWRDWSEYLATATDTEGMVVDNFSIKVFAEPDSGEARDGWELAADGCWTYRLGGELVRSAWTSVDGEWYYFDADARMVSGWVKDAGSWYYMNERHDGTFGAMQTGWVRSDGRWYYLNPASGGPQGAMVTGWQLVDGKWYYLYPQVGAPQGSLAVSTVIDGWKVGPDGAWVA
jgi:glucan-binding YG repeat protein